MINMLAWIGPETLPIVLVVVLLLFGGKKIPELMRGVGQGVGELQKGIEDGKRTLNESIHHSTTVASTPTVEETKVQETTKVL